MTWQGYTIVSRDGRMPTTTTNDNSSVMWCNSSLKRINFMKIVADNFGVGGVNS